MLLLVEYHFVFFFLMSDLKLQLNNATIISSDSTMATMLIEKNDKASLSISMRVVMVTLENKLEISAI